MLGDEDSFLVSVKTHSCLSQQFEFLYEGGSILEYYYEKQRLLRLAYSRLPANAFNLLMLLGVPGFMQDQLCLIDMSKVVLHALSRLKPIPKAEESLNKSRKVCLNVSCCVQVSSSCNSSNSVLRKDNCENNFIHGLNCHRGFQGPQNPEALQSWD